MNSIPKIAFLFIIGSLAACQFLGPDPEEIARQQKITQLNLLFEGINQDIQAKRLSMPEESNALRKLAEVIALSPDHPAIPEIKTNIAQVYTQLIPPSLRNNNLTAAQRYLDSAKTISPAAKGVVESEQLIAQYIKKQVKQAQLEHAQRIEQQEEEAQAVERIQKLAAIAKQKAEFERLIIVRLSQDDINARSKRIGIQLDKACHEIIKNNTSVIIRTQSTRDYKWLAALLKTSVYFIDSDFTLLLEADINASEQPIIRYAK